MLEVDARLQGAIDEFGRRKDPAGLAKAHRVRAGARARLGRIGDCEVDLFEALIAARQSGDHRQITAALGAAPSAALWGPSPVPKAGGRCLDVVRMQRMTTAAPSLEATSLRCLAVLELLRGRPDKARTMLADARQVVADLGLRHGLMETELFAGIIESMEGDPVAAEPHFRTALEGLDALGVGADAGQAAALLARSVLAQGRVDEADRHAAQRATRGPQPEDGDRLARGAGRNPGGPGSARTTQSPWPATRSRSPRAPTWCSTMPRPVWRWAACWPPPEIAKGANDARDDAEPPMPQRRWRPRCGRVGRATPPVTSTASSRRAEPATSRLAVTNRSCEDIGASWRLMRHDVDAPSRATRIGS